MRTFILLCAFFACVSALDKTTKAPSPLAVKRRLDRVKELQPRYKKYLIKLKKEVMDLTDAKLIHRQNNFITNEEFINEFNENSQLGFKLDENEYTDRSPAKFLRIMSNYVQPNIISKNDPSDAPKFDHSKSAISKDVEAEDSVDLRDQMNKVGHQLHCAASWAFTTSAIIGFYHRKHNFWTDEVSKESLIECSPYSKGCQKGGSSIYTLAWLKKEKDGKIASEADYGYSAGSQNTGICSETERKLQLKYKNVFHMKVKDEKQVMKLLTMYGALGTSIYVIPVKKSTFLYYKSGVYSNPDCPPCNAANYDCPVNLDVVLVGYGTTPDGVDYWIIQNCWGETWGEKGYMRIVRNKQNNCSIVSEVWGLI